MKLTILMYHKVDVLSPRVRVPGNFVDPNEFVRQMDALLLWGYEPITLAQWCDYRAGTLSSLPRRPLIVTFDDGYTCFDEHAWPVLQPRGIRPTVFLVSSQIGGYNAWEREEIRFPLLGAARIRALQAEGVHFGSHSVNHVPLARIAPAQALDELTRSRLTLSDLLGREVDTLAYPYSNQSARVRAMARQAGYRCAVRGKGRMNSRLTDPYGLRRIKVEPHTTVAQLRRTLFRERFLRIA